MMFLLAFFLFPLPGAAHAQHSFLASLDHNVNQTSAPGILTLGTNLTATVGDTVDFPCKVVHTQGLGVVWTKNDSSHLIMAERETAPNSRFQPLADYDEDDAQVEQNFGFTLKDVQVDDDDNYFCRIVTEPPISIVHTLIVRAPASVSIVPDRRNLVFKNGETVSLKCLASGKPKPNTTWSFMRASVDHVTSFAQLSTNAELSFTADLSRRGRYKCRAENGVLERRNHSASSERQINVDVHTAPTFTQQPISEVDSSQASAVVQCVFRANPRPSLEWTLNGKPLDLSSKYRLDSRWNQSTLGGYGRLQLSLGETTAYGQYACLLSNDVAAVRSDAVVVDVPTLVQQSVDNNKTYNFVLKSPIKLTQLYLKYTRLNDNEDKYLALEYSKANDTSDHNTVTYRGSKDLAYLQSGFTYDLSLTAENAYGRSREDAVVTYHYYVPASTTRASTKAELTTGYSSPLLPTFSAAVLSIAIALIASL